jgi:DNA-binding CsgD family transcriptional regulator
MPDDRDHYRTGRRLSPQQARVLDLVGEGLTSKEIGLALAISPHTVDQHCKAAIRSLGAHSRADAARRWRSLSPPHRLVSQSPALDLPALDRPFSTSQNDPDHGSTMRDSASEKPTTGSHWVRLMGDVPDDLNAAQLLKQISMWALGIMLALFIGFGLFNGVQLALERIFSN